MASLRTVCFGELLLRLSAPRGEVLLQSAGLDVCVGGAEANVAVALARFGHPVSIVSAVPPNSLGEAAAGELRRHGVDTSGILVRPGRMGLYFLEIGAGLRPSQIVYDRAASSFAETEPGTWDWGRLFDGAHMLHLSGVTPAVGVKAAAAAIAAVHAARERGLQVVFDGNFRSKLWQAWDGNPQAILHDIFAGADIVFADHRDIGIVLARDFSGDAAGAVPAAFDHFPRLQRIVATRRTQHSVDEHELSAVMHTRAQTFTTASHRVTAIVDRIGTGDAFAAGVLHGLLSAMDEQASLEFGLAAGCLKHSVAGDFLRMSAADVSEFLGERRFDVRR